jgi:Secretion system C-terminal sorting domain
MKKSLLFLVSLFFLSTMTRSQGIWNFNSQSIRIAGFEKAWDSDGPSSNPTGPGLDSLYWTHDRSNPANGVMAMAIHWDSTGQHGRMELGSSGNATYLATIGAKFITFWVYLDSAQNIPDSLQIDTYAMDNTNWTWIEEVHFAKDIPHKVWYPLSFPLAAHKALNPSFQYDASGAGKGFMSGLQVIPHNAASVGWHGIIYVDNVSLVDTFVMDNWKWIDARSGPKSISGNGDFPTGVHVVAGDTLHITATGMWWCGSTDYPWAGPEGGNGVQVSFPPIILPNISAGALVGGIGVTSDEHFRTPLVGADTGLYGPGYVGRHFLGVATDSGQIYFAVNDEPLNDNQGGFYLTIAVTRILTGVWQQHPFTPSTYSLSQNYPNPFNPTTIISYQLPVNTLVILKVYDQLGRLVKTLMEVRQTSGSHSVLFDGSNLASGVYFYRMQAGSYIETKKFVLLK